MASKTGSCGLLKNEDRTKIIADMIRSGELDAKNVPQSMLEEYNLASTAPKTSANETKSIADPDITEAAASGKDNHGAATMDLEIVDTTAAAEATKQHNEGSQKSTSPKKHGGLPLLETFGTGCLSCGEDDDHANLLLCEGCNAEYHTYCLDPPLRAVPTCDWFCSTCKADMIPFEDDGLDRLVCALAPSFTSRFGEVCWAQGGNGFGWWPSFIYDPRWTVGNARSLARKNLGKRHLVYFFECHEAPFAVLTTSKITKWEDGLMEDFHMGKTAHAAGKLRTQNFQQAMQAATIELGKPIEMRMDWNHTEQPQILPSPQKKKLKKRKRSENEGSSEGGLSSDSGCEPVTKKSKSSKRSKAPRGFPLLEHSSSENNQVSTKRNLINALEAVTSMRLSNANTIIDAAEDGELYVKLLKKPEIPLEDPMVEDDGPSPESINPSKNIGFVKLPSRKTNTFANVRSIIEKELVPDSIPSDTKWRFFVPGLGPVSSKQEESLGPMFPFLRRTTLDVNLGDGTLLNPLKVFLVELATISNPPVAGSTTQNVTTTMTTSNFTATAENTQDVTITSAANTSDKTLEMEKPSTKNGTIAESNPLTFDTNKEIENPTLESYLALENTCKDKSLTSQTTSSHLATPAEMKKPTIESTTALESIDRDKLFSTESGAATASSNTMDTR